MQSGSPYQLQVHMSKQELGWLIPGKRRRGRGKDLRCIEEHRLKGRGRVTRSGQCSLNSFSQHLKCINKFVPQKKNWDIPQTVNDCISSCSLRTRTRER